MVLGFIFFWPLGLAMLAYIIWGDRMMAAYDEMRPNISKAFQSGGFGRQGGYASCGFRSTGNSAFDAYRDAELKRLEEERQRLETMRQEFDDYLANLRQARDQEEFDRFKASREQRQAG
jgi:Protein of unknown function (DUF2852)